MTEANNNRTNESFSKVDKNPLDLSGAPKKSLKVATTIYYGTNLKNLATLLNVEFEVYQSLIKGNGETI